MIEFELFLEELEKNAGLSDAYRYESRLKVACKLTLGDDHTPKVILMERQRKNAA